VIFFRNTKEKGKSIIILHNYIKKVFSLIVLAILGVKCNTMKRIGYQKKQRTKIDGLPSNDDVKSIFNNIKKSKYKYIHKDIDRPSVESYVSSTTVEQNK
jgi:hypothetical protein